MMWPLALESWRLRGGELPDYDRKDIPASFFGVGQSPP